MKTDYFGADDILSVEEYSKLYSQTKAIFLNLAQKYLNDCDLRIPRDTFNNTETTWLYKDDPTVNQIVEKLHYWIYRRFPRYQTKACREFFRDWANHKLTPPGHLHPYFDIVRDRLHEIYADLAKTRPLNTDEHIYGYSMFICFLAEGLLQTNGCRCGFDFVTIITHQR